MTDQIRIRNKSVGSIQRKFLLADPLNWHTHPEQQKQAIRSIFADVGFVGHLLVRPAKKKSFYFIVDGHARVEEFGPEEDVPCCVLDLDDDEAKRLIVAYDPVGYLAETDGEKLDDLLAGIDEDMDWINEALGREDAGSEGETNLSIMTAPEHPPNMSWVLVGIPTVLYDRIAPMIEELSLVEEATVESGMSDKNV